MPSSRHKETIEVPSSSQLIKRPRPPAGATLMTRLAIAASLLSILSSIMQLMKTVTPELYLQLAIEFWKVLVIIVITAVQILW